MKRNMPLMLLVGLGVVLVAAVAFQPVNRAAALRKGADGYTRIVNTLFVPQQWLTPGPKGVELSQDARAIPGVVKFFNRSELQNDSRNRGYWRIENGVVTELSAAIHNRPLPFQQGRVWTGNLAFRSKAKVITLISANGEFRLDPRKGPDDALAAVDVFQPGTSVEAPVIDLYAGAPDGARNWIVRLQRVGEVVLVQMKGRSAEVNLDGRRLAVADQDFLFPGGQLTIGGNDQPIVLTSEGVQAPALSVYQPLLNSRYRLPQTEAFSNAFEVAMSEAVQSGYPTNASVTTSLDYDLQTRLQDQLTRFAEKGGGHFKAAATVIDTATGEVLAIASYPEESGDPSNTEPARNNNFELMPVGSAAKPPITAAILAERPELAGLGILGRPGPITELFGLDLAAPLEEEAPLSGWIDLDNFLKYSSNRYAASLMLLAGTTRPDLKGALAPDAAYIIGGVEQRGLPPLAFGYTVRDGRVVIDQQNEKLPWLGRLKDLFGIEYEQVRGRGGLIAYGDDLSDMTVWRDLLADPVLARGRPRFLRGLRQISPTRMTFATNKSRSFRSDYVQMIIGGQAYDWTTIKLAEAYARIVTGDMVEATLLESRNPSHWLRTAAWLPEGARLALVHALSLPTEKGGTAVKMQDAIRDTTALAAQRGEELRVYSKTGSPRIEIPVSSAQERAEDALIAARILVLRNGLVNLRTGADLTPVTDDLTLERRLQSDTAAAPILKANGVSVRGLLARARQYNETNDPGLYRIRNGVLYGVTRGGHVTSKDVKVYAIVAGRYAPGAPLGVRPKRALAVVVNIQHQWVKGNEAVIFVNCVLPTTIAPVLFDDPGAARPPTAECMGLGAG